MRLTDSVSDCTTFHVSDELGDALAKFESSGDPRLSIELVPKSSHLENLRNHIKPSDWTRLRKAVAEKARAAGHERRRSRRNGSTYARDRMASRSAATAARSVQDRAAVVGQGDALVALAASLWRVVSSRRRVDFARHCHHD